MATNVDATNDRSQSQGSSLYSNHNATTENNHNNNGSA